MLYVPFDVFTPFIEGRELAIKNNWNDLGNFEDITKRRLDNNYTYNTLGARIMDTRNSALQNQYKTDQQTLAQPGALMVAGATSDAQIRNIDAYSKMLDYDAQYGMNQSRARQQAMAKYGNQYYQNLMAPRPAGGIVPQSNAANPMSALLPKLAGLTLGTSAPNTSAPATPLISNSTAISNTNNSAEPMIPTPAPTAQTIPQFDDDVMAYLGQLPPETQQRIIKYANDPYAYVYQAPDGSIGIARQQVYTSAAGGGISLVPSPEYDVRTNTPIPTGSKYLKMFKPVK